MINFPIGIVLYKPELSSINRILSLAEKGIVFHIFDNSPNSSANHFNVNNVRYYYFNKNLGLSHSINFLCKKLVDENVSKLLFFDQDTVFDCSTLLFVENFIESIEAARDENFSSVVSINFREKSIQKSWLNIERIFDFDSHKVISNYFGINSGTLFFLDKYAAFKWFDENYFVDGVDYFFSLNARVHNFQNISIENVPGLNHSIEQGDSTINILGYRVTSRIYPIRRNYDFLRSHCLLFLLSFRINSIKPKLFLLKAMFGYVFAQVIFRFNRILN